MSGTGNLTLILEQSVCEQNCRGQETFCNLTSTLYLCLVYIIVVSIATSHAPINGWTKSSNFF